MKKNLHGNSSGQTRATMTTQDENYCSITGQNSGLASEGKKLTCAFKRIKPVLPTGEFGFWAMASMAYGTLNSLGDPPVFDYS